MKIIIIYIVMLNGKVAVITVGTRGIGFVTVKLFLDNKCNVVLFELKKESVDGAARS